MKWFDGQRRESNGAALKNGKLYLFGRRGVFVLKLWPSPRCWWKPPAREWCHKRPAFRFRPSWLAKEFLGSRPPPFFLSEEEGCDGQLPLPFPTDESWQRGRAAIQGFFDAIPKSVRAIVAPFPSRQWHLLSLLARCPGAVELARSAPVIAWLLANNFEFHRPAVKQPMRAARSWVRRPRRELIQWLGFPASSVKILSRIVPAAVSIRQMIALRSALADPAVLKLLGHLPIINAGVMAIVELPALRAHVEPKLLLEVAASPHERVTPDCAPNLEWFLDLAEELDLPVSARRFITTRSVMSAIAEAQWLQDALFWRRLRARDPLSLRHAQFPKPPFLPSAGISPLTDAAALIEEGRVQNNCVGDCASMVIAGRFYFYRVESPERATLELCKSAARGWVVGQVKAKNNGPVTGQTRAFIDAWIDEVERAEQEVPEEAPF